MPGADPTSIDVTTASGLTFRAWAAGPQDGQPVLLLHGFPQSRHAWRNQIAALAAAGYRALAPDQRGYSPGARPDPSDHDAYLLEHLVDDALQMVDAHVGAGRPFHLVGHDWGGQVAWATADRGGARVRSLTILSRPHPQAFVEALRSSSGDQAHRSRHHKAFLGESTGPDFLADGATRLRTVLSGGGVPDAVVQDYVEVLGTPDAMEAALAWYRAMPRTSVKVGTIQTPTLYVWGDQDSTISREAVAGTAAFVSGPYRFVELPGIGHFSSDQAPDAINDLLLQHLRANPGA